MKSAFAILMILCSAGADEIDFTDDAYTAKWALVDLAIPTYEEFRTAVTGCGFPSPPRAKYDCAISQAEPKGRISTKREFAMFLAQIVWESAGLTIMSETACEVTKCPNDYHTPGCDAPGQYYYGRGYMQLSWCYNYRAASRDLFNDDRLIRNPDLVAREDNLAWATAFWFWKVNVHNKPGVQDGRFGASTNAINGAMECRGMFQEKAKKRFGCYREVFEAFNLHGSPDERGCYN